MPSFHLAATLQPVAAIQRLGFLALLCLLIGFTTPVIAFEAQVYHAQEILHALGYSVGNADGLNGRKTRAALKNFQQDNALSTSGKLDQNTREMLAQTAQKKNINAFPTPQQRVEASADALKKMGRERIREIFLVYFAAGSTAGWAVASNLDYSPDSAIDYASKLAMDAYNISYSRLLSIVALGNIYKLSASLPPDTLKAIIANTVDSKELPNYPTLKKYLSPTLSPQ